MKIFKVMCNLHPQATDRDFVDKLNSKFKTVPNFEVVRSHTPLFTIVHYAGKVRSHNTCIIIPEELTRVPVWRVFLCSGAIQRQRFSGEEQRHYSGQHPGAFHQQRDSSAQRSLCRFVTLSQSERCSLIPHLWISENQKRVWLNRSVMWTHLHTGWEGHVILNIGACVFFIAILNYRRCLCDRSVWCFSATISRTGTLMPRKAKVEMIFIKGSSSKVHNFCHMRSAGSRLYSFGETLVCDIFIRIIILIYILNSIWELFHR